MTRFSSFSARRIGSKLRRVAAGIGTFAAFVRYPPAGVRLVLRPRRLHHPSAFPDLIPVEAVRGTRAGLRETGPAIAFTAAPHLMVGCRYFMYRAGRMSKFRKEGFHPFSLCDVHIADAFVMMNHAAGNYFHSVFERGFHYYLLASAGHRVPVLWIGPALDFERELMELLGPLLDLPFIHVPHQYTCCVLDNACHLDVPGRSLFEFPPELRGLFPDYVALLKRELASGSGPPPLGPRVYSFRSGSRRVLANDAEVSAVFARHGYRQIDFKGVSIRDSAALVAGTQVFAGVHGANLSNMLFLEPGAAVLEIVPRNKAHNRTFRNCSAMLGLSYLALPIGDDMRVDPAGLEAALTAIEATAHPFRRGCG